ncbi:MAG: PAS domain S-box protein, partial [Pseudomonadota bacterium]|nr:PAS domain S-box protein [Pseudomonadota bacterium]
ALLVSTAAAAALSLAFAPVGLSAGFLPTFVEQWFARASGAVLLVVPLLLLRRDTERVAASVQQQWRSLLIVAGVGIGYLFAAWRAEFSWLGDLYAVVLPWVAIGALMAFLLTPLLAGCVALLCFGCLIAGVWWFHYVPDSTADLTGLLVVQAYLVSTVLAVQFYGMLSAQRARQQRVLAELENRFQLLAEQSLQGIWVQRRGNLLYSNAAGARIFGYRTPEELLSLGSLWPLIHPDERDRIARYHEQRLKGEQAPTLLEFRALHRDGRELVIETVATTLDWEGAPAVQNVLIDVSERVEAQGELAERERQYRNLLANLPGAAYRFVLVDESWRIEFVSAGVKEMLGYEPDDLLSGRRDFVNDLLHPEDRDKLGAAVSEAVRGGSMYRLTYRLKHADGRYRHVLGHGCTVSDPDTRRVTAVEGIIIDITDRIEAERRLKLSEARYRNFVEHSNEGVFRIDFDPPIPIGLPVDSQLEAAFARGVFSDSNDLAIRLIGFEPDQLKQTPLGLTAVMPHWRSAETRNALRQFILAGYSAVQMPLALRCTEERTLMTSISASGVVKDGALCQVWGVFVDVTDRFETQQRLRQSEHRFRSIFEESPLGIYLSDDAFTFRQVNPALCEMLGYDAQALLGRHVYDGLLVSEDRAQTEALAQSVRAGESNSYTAERRYLHRDGHTVWTRAHVARLNGDTERSGLVLALLEDITEVVVAEDRAARHRQEMMEADKMISLGTLVSGVAHEINNPNQNISLNAPFLEEVWKDLMPLLDEYITSGGRIDRGSGLPWEELRQEVPRASKRSVTAPPGLPA